jgi:hypothetical protein
VTPQNFPLLSLPPQLYTEQNPGVTCGLPNPPAWCADYVGGSKLGRGFLQGGGLLQTNVPCDTQLLCRQSTSSFIVDVVEPKVLTWSLGVQHELGWNSSLEARYVGTRSLELPVQSRLNTQTLFRAGLDPMPTYLNASDVPATVASPATTLSQWETSYIDNSFTTCPTTAPNPFIYGAQGFCATLVTAFPPLGSGIYHGVSLDFKHRVGHGLSLFANYTFSKNIDDATNDLFTSRVQPRRPQDWQNIGAERGLSALDQTHKLAVSWVYDFPSSHADNAFVRGVADGWRLSGSWLVMSGPPVTIINGGDANGDFDSAGDRPIFNPSGTVQAGTYVDFVCNAGAGGATTIVSDPTTCGTGNDANIVGYVAQDPTAKYVTAELGAVGTLGRDSYRSPGLQTWAMSFAKTTKINERVGVQFRADFDNIFNHRNFVLSQPTALYNTANAGQAITQTYNNIQATGSGFLDAKQFDGGSRTMQLVLKLTF